MGVVSGPAAAELHRGIIRASSPQVLPLPNLSLWKAVVYKEA